MNGQGHVHGHVATRFVSASFAAVCASTLRTDGVVDRSFLAVKTVGRD